MLRTSGIRNTVLLLASLFGGESLEAQRGPLARAITGLVRQIPIDSVCHERCTVALLDDRVFGEMHNERVMKPNPVLATLSISLGDSVLITPYGRSVVVQSFDPYSLGQDTIGIRAVLRSSPQDDSIEIRLEILPSVRDNNIAYGVVFGHLLRAPQGWLGFFRTLISP